MVWALIKEQSRLLTTNKVGHVGCAVHRNRDRTFRCRTYDNTRFVIQPFQSTCTSSSIFQNIADTCHFCHRGRQHWQMGIGPSRVRLDHASVAKAINNNTRKAICLCVDQAVEWGIKQLLTQFERACDFRYKPGMIQLCIWVSIQNACDDFGVRIYRNQTKGLAQFILQNRQSTRGQCLGATVCNHLISIDPWETMADGTCVCFRHKPYYGAGDIINKGRCHSAPSSLLCPLGEA